MQMTCSDPCPKRNGMGLCGSFTPFSECPKTLRLTECSTLFWTQGSFKTRSNIGYNRAGRIRAREVRCRKMNAGGNPVAWFYEIFDSKNAVVETGEGFAT